MAGSDVGCLFVRERAYAAFESILLVLIGYEIHLDAFLEVIWIY